MTTKDSIRGLVQLASGVGEMTVAKANQTAHDLAALAGLDDQLKKKQLTKQVSAIAADLMHTASANRDQLVSLVRAEVDKAMSRADLAKVGDLDAAKASMAALVAQVEDLSAQLRANLPGASHPVAAPLASVPARDELSRVEPQVPTPARKRPPRSAIGAKRTAPSGGVTSMGPGPGSTAPGTAAKKAPARTAPAKRAAGATTAARKAPAKKAGTTTAARKAPAKKAGTTTAARKAPAKKAAGTTTAATKAPAKKAAGTTTAAKKAPAKKAAGTTTTTTKASAKKAPAKKAPAKRTTSGAGAGT